MRKQVKDTNLRLMVFQSAKELGEKVNEHLLKMYNISRSYIFIYQKHKDFIMNIYYKTKVEEYDNKNCFLIYFSVL